MKTSILISILIVMASTVNNCNGTKTTASDPKVAQTINKRQLPDTISLRLDDLDSIQNNEVKQSEDEDYSDYYESEDYKALKRVMDVEPDGRYRPISYFWYEINLDGKNELWVLYYFDYYDEGHWFGWELFAFEINKKRHDIKEMGHVRIPRFSTIHKGKGYLLTDFCRMGYQAWNKISWKNGIKNDCIYESEDYGGRRDSTYLEPKEPELKMKEVERGFDELVMTQVFGIWDED